MAAVRQVIYDRLIVAALSSRAPLDDRSRNVDALRERQYLFIAGLRSGRGIDEIIPITRGTQTE